jgi:hypothetical protein
MSELQFPDVRIGDDVVIFNDESMTDYVSGKVTAVGSRTIDAYCISERGLELRRDVIHATDPRIPVLQQQEYFNDGTRGIFRIADATSERRDMATQIKAQGELLQLLVRRVSALEQAARSDAPEATPQARTSPKPR